MKLGFLIVLVLLSIGGSSSFAKTGTDQALVKPAEAQKTLAPFTKQRSPKPQLPASFFAPAAPQIAFAPRPAPQAQVPLPLGSISRRNYYGFEIGMTAGMLMGGDLDIIYDYPFSNRGDTMSVRLETHSVALRYSLGGILDYALNDWVSMQGKLSFRMLGATSEEQTKFWCFSLTTLRGDSATFNESYEMNLGYLGLDMLGRIQLMRDSWYALAGFGMSSLITSSVHARETITSANDCQYTFNHANALVMGNVAEEEDVNVDEDLVGGRFDLRAGIGTFIPIGDNGMMLTPELTVGIPLNAVVDPATHDTRGIRSNEPPSHFYASLSVGLKFPWGDYAPEGSLSGNDGSADDKRIVGYIEVREGNGILSGRIVDEQGNLIRDGSIVVVDLSTNRVIATDDAKDGTYSVKIEGEGKYSVTADAPGFLFGSTPFEVDREGRILIESSELKLARSTDGRVRLLIFFEFDKAVLQPSSYPELNRAAALMKANPNMVVEIAGFTDAKGSDNYNLDLSERRAIAVREYIAAQGVEMSRLSAAGYGESSPVSTNDTEEGRAVNRRVEFVVKRK